MNFKIRAATHADAIGIAQVHVASWRTTYKGIFADSTIDKIDVDERAKQWTERLASPQAQTCTFVATDLNDRIIGFANSGPLRSEDLKTDGELYAIYLAEKCQRKN